MLAFGVLLYGFLLSFVLTSTSRNKRDGRANPRMLMAVGYVLCGLSAGLALMLPLLAAYDPGAAAMLVGMNS